MKFYVELKEIQFGFLKATNVVNFREEKFQTTKIR